VRNEKKFSTFFSFRQLVNLLLSQQRDEEISVAFFIRVVQGKRNKMLLLRASFIIPTSMYRMKEKHLAGRDEKIVR